MTDDFSTWLFTHDTQYAAAADRAGMSGIVVDWECRGKEDRQRNKNTEINHGTPQDLARMRHAVRGRLACRINNDPGTRAEEARLAAELGAQEVWLPMVQSIEEIEDCLRALPLHCRMGILVETDLGLGLARDLAKLPLCRLYVGLNDLWISSGRPHLFSALIDGTVERFREAYPRAFAVGGVTRPSLGTPIPCRLLLAEMSRLRCDFGIARRAFRRDTPANEIPKAIHEIHGEMLRLGLRSTAAISRDREHLATKVAELEGTSALRPAAAR